MESLVDQIGELIVANQAWAGPILAAIAFGEALIIVGFFFPATALMLLTGGLIGAGQLDGLSVLLWLTAGAVAGDAASYFLGRWVGPSLWQRWPLNRDREKVIRARAFFRRYGVLSIVVGRFLGPLRSIVPAVAGVMAMDHRKFQIANIVSAVIWVPAMLAPGYFAGSQLATLGQVMSVGDWGLLALLAIAVTILGSWLILRFFSRRAQTARIARARRERLP